MGIYTITLHDKKSCQQKTLQTLIYKYQLDCKTREHTVPTGIYIGAGNKMIDLLSSHIGIVLKHITAFFSLCDHYILSLEWRVIAGRPMGL